MYFYFGILSWARNPHLNLCVTWTIFRLRVEQNINIHLMGPMLYEHWAYFKNHSYSQPFVGYSSSNIHWIIHSFITIRLNTAEKHIHFKVVVVSPHHRYIHFICIASVYRFIPYFLCLSFMTTQPSLSLSFSSYTFCARCEFSVFTVFIHIFL